MPWAKLEAGAAMKAHVAPTHPTTRRRQRMIFLFPTGNERILLRSFNRLGNCGDFNESAGYAFTPTIDRIPRLSSPIHHVLPPIWSFIMATSVRTVETRVH